jgi:fumarate reductase iron-sulfur subunit
MTVNGRARWTCRTHVEAVAADGRLEIAPLANLPVIRDLVTDMREFFDKWARAKGQFAPTATRRDDLRPSSRRRGRARRGCRDRMHRLRVCYASCDVVGWNPAYLGPAALNRAWTLVNDARDGARRARLGAVAGDAGCHACHTHQSCTDRARKRCRRRSRSAGLNGARPLRATESVGMSAARMQSLLCARTARERRRARPLRRGPSRTMIVAVRGGLTAAEILGRTRGSVAWTLFYGVFVAAVAIHAPIGVRTCLPEDARRHGRGIDVAMLAFASLLLVLGWRAVAAVTMGRA